MAIPPTERERCPTCDHELACVYDVGEPPHTPPLCFDGYARGHGGPPIDWRARALAAEAQLAGVRPLVEALERIAGGLCPGSGTLIAGTMFAPCRKCAACQADAALAAYRTLSRTEGRAGDGEAKP